MSVWSSRNQAVLKSERPRLRASAAWSSIVCTLGVLACGGADKDTAASELGASGQTVESAAGRAGSTSAPKAGAQAAPAQSAGRAAAPSSNNPTAGTSATALPPASAGSTGSSTSSAGAGVGAAGSAGVQGQAAAGAAGTSVVAGSGATSPTAACDRACLTGISDAYLDALIAHDATQLKTAGQVRFTENGKPLQLTEGLWASARSIGDYRQDFAEVPAGQTAGFVSLQDERGDVLLAFRLKVVNAEVTEIETTVCRNGEASFFSPNALMRNPLFDEDIAADARLSREELIAIVDSYFAGIESSDGSKIPFSDSARRNENGVNTGSGTGLQNVAMFSYIETIERRYALVDVERGNALPWVLFQIPSSITGSRTLHLAEAFKVSDGKIQDVQAIMVNQPLGTPGGWE
jgi:hypothetical protein